jgi:ribosomal protein S18 acetylase RimI-like enzyme
MTDPESQIPNPKPAVVVRPATVEDAPHVGEILVEGFGSKFGIVFGRRIDRAAYVVAQIERLRLKRGVCALLVAEVDGRVAGVLELTARRERLSDLWGQFLIMLRGVGPLYSLRAAIGLVLLHEATVRDTAYLENIAVAAGFRSRGIGWRLLESAEGWAQARGRRSLSLHVAASNPARHLYERFGFRLEERIEQWLTERLFGIRVWLYMMKPLSGEDDVGR